MPPKPASWIFVCLSPCVTCSRIVGQLRNLRHDADRVRKNHGPAITSATFCVPADWIFYPAQKLCVSEWRKNPFKPYHYVYRRVFYRLVFLQLDEERDFACVFQADGSDTITWDKETRCRVRAKESPIVFRVLAGPRCFLDEPTHCTLHSGCSAFII